jgi:uncharacterized protein
VIQVADLLRQAGTRREIHVDRIAVSGSQTNAVARADLLLESVTGPALVASGTVTADWTGECRRCLGDAVGTLTADVRELFEPASDEEETYLLRGDQIDVEPLVRDAVLLELPLAPLCREDCAGLCPVCGANRNEGDCGHKPDERDPRWAALDQLKD